jgi:serine/threonine protein kinase
MSDSGPIEETIFIGARELSKPHERAAYLDRACGGDHALRDRVERMLNAEKNADHFFSNNPVDVDKTALVTFEGGQEVGMVIGRYKLLQQLGEGGCGIVYMAEQEHPIRRRVALKVIKPGMDSKQVIARFEAERQALALMDHPNIAKVLDAGTIQTQSVERRMQNSSADSPLAARHSSLSPGRPYFVMELVRGIRITDYCDQNNLTTQDRLNLFVKVVQAVQHAHQKGIIHRDIKPSNILVTLHDGVPVPKVIDFGIAKALEQKLTDKTLFTQFEQFIGTPAYTSPEQAEMSGLDVDTRSDIYSLGVLLYELLVGKTPFDAQDLVHSGLDEMRRIIREQEPARPSTRLRTMLQGEITTTAQRRRVSVPELVHQLKGDLDWIVIKCLEKDRTRRYDTANALGSDIEHYLGNEPITARPAQHGLPCQQTGSPQQVSLRRRHSRDGRAGDRHGCQRLAGDTRASCRTGREGGKGLSRSGAPVFPEQGSRSQPARGTVRRPGQGRNLAAGHRCRGSGDWKEFHRSSAS